MSVNVSLIASQSFKDKISYLKIEFSKAMEKAELDFDDIESVIDTWSTVISTLELPSLFLISAQNFTLIISIYMCLGGTYQIYSLKHIYCLH